MPTPQNAGFAGLQFDNTYARLPEYFYSRVNPSPVPKPGLIRVNHALARHLNLDPRQLERPEGLELLAGNRVAPGSQPLAQAYAGHQFGYFNHQLGDGRAVLLGEVLDADGQRRDIQLKGAGRTPYSRAGDGRAAVGPVVREYLVSEAMHALGIRTTRALAAVTTGEPVYRETALPGAVLTRVAASHLRIGTFEFFWARNQQDAVKQLADYTIERHYPQAKQADNPYLALQEAVMEAQAALVASWMRVGFVHGVMNTDNMSISGETVDYGPCAFTDTYDLKAAFSSIDTRGRYAFGQQAGIALWNLTRLAECLLHLFDSDTKRAVAKAEAQLEKFAGLFDGYWLKGMRSKLGLTIAHESDASLIQQFLQILQASGADFTLTFRALGDSVEADESAPHALLSQVGGQEDALREWLEHWRARLAMEQESAAAVTMLMRQNNPLYIPRNHRVEAVVQSATQQGDFQPFHEMLEVLQRPFEAQPGMECYAQPPEPSDTPYRTFCGT